MLVHPAGQGDDEKGKPGPGSARIAANLFTPTVEPYSSNVFNQVEFFAHNGFSGAGSGACLGLLRLECKRDHGLHLKSRLPRNLADSPVH